MKAEELINAQQNLQQVLNAKIDELHKIKESNDSISSKWQKFIELIIPIQFSEIRKLLYSGNQDGFSKFSIDVMQASKANAKLKELNEEKWKFLLENAFGISEYKEVTLEKAQQMIKEIAESMQTSSFLQQVDKLATAGYGALPMVEKRKGILNLLMPLYISVFKKYGFEGENAYVVGQRALLDYHSDPFIKGHLNLAQFNVFTRAKLV